MAHGSRKGVGPGSATSLTREWFFCGGTMRVLFGPVPIEAQAQTAMTCLKISVRAVWRPEEKGTFGLVT